MVGDKLDQLRRGATDYLQQVLGAVPGTKGIQDVITGYILKAYLAGIEAERNRQRSRATNSNTTI